jgi:hypothetical protein
MTVLYEDAMLYDVCYIVREAPQIDPFVEIEDIKLSSTCIRVYLTGLSEEELKLVPVLTDAAWSSGPALARQIRAYLEHCDEELRKRIGLPNGGRELRVSVCEDGAVGAIDWGHDLYARFGCRTKSKEMTS